MPRKENLISEIQPKKGTWKLAVRITDMWFVQKGGGNSSVEMVLMDQTGCKIGATLNEELFKMYRHLLNSGSTYVLQNFSVQKNQGEWKVSNSDFMLYFVKSTVVKECPRPEIPWNVYHFTSFTDIISGVAKPDILVDIIGVVVDKLEQHTRNPPYRVTVVLRDKSDVEMVVTLWEGYAAKLGAALDQNKIDEDPLVLMLTLSKIKKATDKYPLSVQNTKIGSKLYINPDMEEICDVLKELNTSKGFYTGVLSQGERSSQCLSSQLSQSSSASRFIHNARIIRMNEIKNLTQDIYCLTVGTVDEILVKDPWSYNSCTNCTTSVVTTICPNCKTTFEKPVPRYKLVIKMEHDDEREKFTFWDQICNKMLKKSAAVCRQELIDDGEDVNAFPECVDELLGKKFALRFKFRFQYCQASVIDISDDEDIMQQILARLPPKQDEVAITKEKTVIGGGDSQESYPTPDLSMSSEFDPNTAMFMTPAKRVTTDLSNEHQSNEGMTPYQYSSNKHIKSE